MLSDIEIAQRAKMKDINEIAEMIGLDSGGIEPYGHYKAKISNETLEALKDKDDGKLVLVTAVNPTPAGEGKTTVSIGLSQAINKLGKKAVAALREPSLGPVFGIKGGAAFLINLLKPRFAIQSIPITNSPSPILSLNIHSSSVSAPDSPPPPTADLYPLISSLHPKLPSIYLHLQIYPLNGIRDRRSGGRRRGRRGRAVLSLRRRYRSRRLTC